MRSRDISLGDSVFGDEHATCLAGSSTRVLIHVSSTLELMHRLNAHASAASRDRGSSLLFCLNVVAGSATTTTHGSVTSLQPFSLRKTYVIRRCCIGGISLQTSLCASTRAALPTMTQHVLRVFHTAIALLRAVGNCRRRRSEPTIIDPEGSSLEQPYSKH